MTYTLAIGDRTYSSWSLRGWLLFEKFDLPVNIVSARMYSEAFRAMLAQFDMADLVPALRIGKNGADFCMWDTLAIAEMLAERHPVAGFWPKNPAARGFARSITAEMHAGFAALRNECTMNLRHAYPDFTARQDVRRDVARIDALWSEARRRHGATGPWLFGTYSVADAFFAPVATRFATYHLDIGPVASEYVNTVLADPAFRRWRAMGLAENHVQPGYDLDLPPYVWPGPTPLAAQAVHGETAINQTCPYSGKPVSRDALARINGHIIGFCNTFCRDTTVADPEAWPATMA
ncbi:MAG: glutathione S-transferase, partial [Halocynthiibacter sp.]